MESDQDRVAVVLGSPPAGTSGGLALSSALPSRAVADVAELLDVVRAGDALVALVDQARVDDVDRAELADAADQGGLDVPLVAFGCADAASAARAVAAGADFAIRADADAAEVAALLRLCVTRRDLELTCRSQERELHRQRALSLKDDLTAAYNRRFFDRSLDEELNRARRAGAPLSLIFMDLDNLKAVNQKYGHAMGSAVLQEAAARTIRGIRSIDKVVRYGGDEFCIILPGADAKGAREVAERIRSDLATRPFAVDATGGVTLTASFGIASYPEHATEKQALVTAADKAMFQIKESQKNGILVAARTGP